MLYPLPSHFFLRHDVLILHTIVPAHYGGFERTLRMDFCFGQLFGGAKVFRNTEKKCYDHNDSLC
jgi:hypothetical protein